MKPSTSLWLLALLFGTCETGYFGWNLMPGSDSEMICDGITALLAGMALLCRSAERRS